MSNVGSDESSHSDSML